MKVVLASILVLILQINQSYTRQLPQKKFNLKEECGIINTDDFIIGGNEAEPNKYPWMALQWPGQVGCGAALISDQWLLTAAHCDYGQNINVRLGAHDHTAESEPNRIEVQIEKQINHEDYDFPRNDIALMKLVEPVDFNDYIRPICLPTRTEAQKEYWGADVKGIGWGIADNDPDYLKGLREVDLNIITKDQQTEWCIQADYPSVLCVQTENGTVGVCYGDSGSPLLYRRDGGQYATIGVASFVLDGCQGPLPSGYNSVLHHLDWIEKHTGIDIEP